MYFCCPPLTLEGPSVYSLNWNVCLILLWLSGIVISKLTTYQHSRDRGGGTGRQGLHNPETIYERCPLKGGGWHHSTTNIFHFFCVVSQSLWMIVNTGRIRNICTLVLVIERYLISHYRQSIMNCTIKLAMSRCKGLLTIKLVGEAVNMTDWKSICGYVLLLEDKVVILKIVAHLWPNAHLQY